MPKRIFAALIIALLAYALPRAQAQTATDADPDVRARIAGSPFETVKKRRLLGYGRLTTNDLFGDGEDRWRTGSVTTSRAWGYDWNGTAPSRPGQLLEMRLQGQIIAPDRLNTVDPADRPYAGAISLGVHTYAANRGVEYALGADLVAIGPQTRLDDFQRSLHDLLGITEPGAGILGGQIGDMFRPTLVTEIGRIYRLGDAAVIRPFAEARAGDETLLRAGADFTFGSVGLGELLSRESVTGQRYRVIYRSTPGFSLTVGADTAYVADSVYLPESRGYSLTDRRDRARAGLHWQGRNASVFYGLTYLGREFTGQNEGQLTGSLRVKLRF